MPLTPVMVRFLELTRETFSPKHVARDGLAFTLVDPPQPELNGVMYNAVGGPWYWLDRRAWTVAQWAEHLARGAAIETWLLSVRGIPAGYAELERRGDGDVEVLYFGLLAPFIGQGLGAHMLSLAAERAFALGASKVLLNTCDLDHPQALANYRARGFEEVRRQITERDIPDAPPG